MTREKIIDGLEIYTVGRLNKDLVHITVEELQKFIDAIKDLEQEPKTGHCEDCKYFRKLPHHADTLGKCFHHGGFCPKGDWYCADFEPQESEVNNG